MPLRWVERGADRAARFPRGAKISIALAADAVALPLMFLLALALRRGSFAEAMQASPWAIAIAVAMSLGVFWSLGMYRWVFRFISHDGLRTSTVAVLLSTALFGSVNFTMLAEPVRINAIAIFGALMLLYLIVSRSFVRQAFHFRRGAKERVAIYGAGSAGAQLLRALRETGKYTPIAFVDDDVALRGKLVDGVKIYSPSSLPTLVGRKKISSVVLALPSCTYRRRLRILQSLESLPVHVRSVPDIGEILAGRAAVADLRDVGANELLGRDPVAPNRTLLEACIRDKVVLVTGAGGSIGSELCRQIVRLQPRRLVLLEISEPALYHIERNLRQIAGSNSIEIIALLGNAMHRARMRELMQMYGVQTVYHAAAYKHVPIVERNAIEGIRNNLLSTWFTAEAALECGIETFVLISTDKAVNPSNVMGAAKRLAELTLQAMQERSKSTRFCMVRFGNVLESSGSVVPLFREQIKRGGPVTVTHREIIRYFMTIPEASQLVLQAGSMAHGGDVFVLDMGEPVRILDLAKRMISLMGRTFRDEKNPEGDIEIVYTGLRPAEKLYEELLIGANVTGTEHPMIMRAMEHHIPWEQLHENLTQLARALDEFDCAQARDLLMRTVAEYRPNSPIEDLVWLRGQEIGPDRSKVTTLRTHQQRAVRGGDALPVAH